MAAADTVLLIAVVAVLGFALAWLVGKVADRDKAKREAANPPPPPAAGALSAGAAPALDAALGACPTCRTAYRPDLAFCWACGRDKVAP